MTDHKFQNLRFKIYLESDKGVKDIIKPLEKYPSFKKLKEHPSYLPIIKYLIFLYDPKTDLNLEFVRLEDRKAKAAELSGLAKVDEELYKAIDEYRHQETWDVIQTLLTEIFHDAEYREWQTLNKELDEYTKARWKPADINKKSDLETRALLRKQCQEILDTKTQLEQSIFGDHVKVKEAAYKSRFINPESFARAMKQNN